MAWVVAVVAIAAVLVPAVIATDAAGRVAEGDFDRYVVIEPGSTSEYRTTTNGKDTGALTEQILSPAQVEALLPSTVAVGDHFEDFLGTGAPLDQRTYTALEADRVVTFGSRVGSGGFQPSDPPEIALQPPLEEGASWTWKGTRRGGTGRTVTTIEEIADRPVLGRTFRDCLRLKATSHDTDADGNASTDVTGSWLCPEAGLVSVDEEFRQGNTTVRFSSEVIEIHHPGLNLGARPPLAANALRPKPGQVPAVDSGHSWYVPDATLSTDRLAWSLGRKSDSLYTPVGVGDAVVTAEDDGTIASTDIRTGQVTWQIGLTGPIVASPVVAGGLVLVADSSKSLWALDAATGRARWVLRLSDVVSATPAVTGDVIVVPTDDRTVTGVLLSTGEALWSDTTNALVVDPPVVAAGLVVVGDQVGNLTALRPADGDTVWSDSSISLFSGGTVLLGGLAAGGDTLVASSDASAVFVYDAATGDLRWRAQAPDTIDRPVAVAGDLVAIASQSSIEVRGIDDGALVWRRTTGTTFAPPLVVGDTVAVLRVDNRLLTFSLATGAESSVEIGSADEPSDQDTKLPMAWVAGALVVPTHNLGPWPFTVYQAFPAPLPSAPDTGPVQGVRLAGRFFVVDVPSGPSSLDGDRMEVAAEHIGDSEITGKVVESAPGGPISGPQRILYRNNDVPSYALAAGDRVVAGFGSRVVGVSRTGDEPWTAEGGDLLPGTVPIVVPSPAGPMVVTPDKAGGLTGIDAATGERRWGPVAKAKFAFGSPTLLADGTVAWGGGAVTVIDPENGRVLRRNPSVASFTTLAEDGGRLFGIFATDPDVVLAALDERTLQPVWAQPFTSAQILGAIPIAPGAGDGVVAVVDSTNVLRALDGATGEELWNLQLRLAPNSPPIVRDGRVFVEEPGFPEDLNQHEHRVTVLDARTGAMEASWEIPGALFFADMFRVSDGHLLVTVPNGIVAVDPEVR